MLHWLQIVSKLLTILKRTCIKLIFNQLQNKTKIVRSLRTICLQWSIEFIKIAHILQVSWRESFHPKYLMLEVQTEILVEL